MPGQGPGGHAGAAILICPRTPPSLATIWPCCRQHNDAAITYLFQSRFALLPNEPALLSEPAVAYFSGTRCMLCSPRGAQETIMHRAAARSLELKPHCSAINCSCCCQLQKAFQPEACPRAAPLGVHSRNALYGSCSWHGFRNKYQSTFSTSCEHIVGPQPPLLRATRLLSHCPPPTHRPTALFFSPLPYTSGHDK